MVCLTHKFHYGIFSNKNSFLVFLDLTSLQSLAKYLNKLKIALGEVNKLCILCRKTYTI